MNNRRLTLVNNRKNRKIVYRLITVLLLLALICFGIYFIYVEFSIDSIEVKGNTTYTEKEIIDSMKSQRYVGNTLVMIALNKLTGDTYLPFVEKISMSFDESHVLKLKVKERIRAGVFEYSNRNVYFDSEGIALESRKSRFEGVPVVTGVKYDKLVLGKKIPVKSYYFETIVLITKKIATYQLDISQINFESEDDIYLVSGEFRIRIGSSQYIGEKMSKISEILKAVSKKNKSGTIDMHLYTEDKDIITFYK